MNQTELLDKMSVIFSKHRATGPLKKIAADVGTSTETVRQVLRGKKSIETTLGSKVLEAALPLYEDLEKIELETRSRLETIREKLS